MEKIVNISNYQRNANQTLGFSVGSVIKNLPANVADMDLIPELARSPGEGIAAHSSILAWRIPWTEEPGGL